MTRTFARRVIVESPYAGNVEQNLTYARACMRDCLERGEAPYASHLLFTQPGILNDEDPAERVWGIEAGLAWGGRSHRSWMHTIAEDHNGDETHTRRRRHRGEQDLRGPFLIQTHTEGWQRHEARSY